MLVHRDEQWDYIAQEQHLPDNLRDVSTFMSKLEHNYISRFYVERKKIFAYPSVFEQMPPIVSNMKTQHIMNILSKFSMWLDRLKA